MKKLYFILLAVCLIGMAACENKEPKDKQIIASNLLNKGSVDTALLVGEWELVKFAFTIDGNTISDVATISDVVNDMMLNYISINVPNEEYVLSLCDIEPQLCTYDLSSIWTFSFCYSYLFYSVSENLTSFIISYFPYMVNIILTDDGNDVMNALKNAYSFVIRSDELIIHFTGVKNKNLLILKKREL